VIAHVPTGPDGAPERWKYTRYWDNPAYWTQPNVQDVQTIVGGVVNAPGTKVAQTTVKASSPTTGQIAPPLDQFEMYNVSLDPTEMTNLYGNSDYIGAQQYLAKLLDAERAVKRLSPTEQPWADGSMQQFPYVPS
jgi:choline-sulfatase